MLAVVGLWAVVLALYLLWARPIQLHWGATDEEVRRSMPGDELDPAATYLATRAITIDGTPQEIWPWLMQMGYTRAGFYGFDLFERVGSPRGPRGVERILPEFQDFKTGDEVPISPVMTMRFESIIPFDTIVWSAGETNGSVTWGLYPVDGSHTRLVNRTRWTHHWTSPKALSLDLLTEFTDALAMRKVLQGIKGRAEGDIQMQSDVNIEFVTYVGALIVCLWAAVSVLRLPLNWVSWLVGLAGGLVWLITWYAPTSMWFGAGLALLVVWAMRVEFRDLHRSKAFADKHAATGARK